MRLASTTLLILLGLAAPAAHSQTGGGPAAAPAAKAGDLCSMDGRVLDALTGEPLKKASLKLTPSNAKSALAGGAIVLPQVFTTSTDASGRYAMKDLDPGTYRLQVTRNGYVPGEYGARGPSKPGMDLTLARGQQARDVVVKLTPQGVISGRVVDEDGDPVASTTVQLLTPGYSGGKKQLSTAGSATTNDLGEYRAFGLAPGKYYVTAGSLLVTTEALSVDRSAEARPEESYVATYYPGAVDPVSATPVEVQPGAQTRGIDITLQKARTVRVAGRVNAPGRVPLLILAPRTLAGALSIRMVRVDASGSFEIRGVSAGSYSLTGSTQQNGKTYSGSQPVEIGDSNLDGLIFTLAPGVPVAGHIRIDGGAALDPAKLRIRLGQREMGLGALVGAIGSVLSGGDIGGSTGKVNDDLTFQLNDISSDTYDVSVSGLPEGYFVESVRSGEADVLLSGLEVKGSSPQPLEIVLSPHGAQINGAVHNASHQPAAHATVVLVPRDKERSGHASYYRDAAIGSDGQFHFQSVPPGEYGLYAWEDVDAGAWMDPDFLKPFEGSAHNLTVHADGHESADLALIPEDTAAK